MYFLPNPVGVGFRNVWKQVQQCSERRGAVASGWALSRTGAPGMCLQHRGSSREDTLFTTPREWTGSEVQLRVMQL